MPFGTVIASHTQTGTPLLPMNGGKAGRYLCDGLSRPNPGTTKPVVHDGNDFLKLPRPTGTNHRSIYVAIAEALTNAKNHQVSELEISLPSRLVWGQITQNGGVRKLRAERDRILTLAGGFQQVIWHLVEPPFVLPTGPVNSTRSLRRMAP
jgi:hypothetical protein